MKKHCIIIAISSTIALCVILAGCGISNSDKLPTALAVHTNLEISVVGRLMTVTWDAVDNASGYTIYTTSIGCASGNRVINTDNQSATNHKGDVIASAVAAQGVTTNGDGFVTFIGETSFTILLMTDPNDEDMPEAMGLTAKVMAISDNESYIASEYSEVVTLDNANYLKVS